MDRTDDRKDQLKWKWGGGSEVLQADLGSPGSTTAYTLCIYDSTGGVDALAASLQMGLLNNYWRTKDPKGWSYKEKNGGDGGVVKVQLRTGPAGKPKAQLQAKGVHIPMPTPFTGAEFFNQDGRVTVQLFNNATSTCWNSEFTSSTENTATQFEASMP